MMKEVDEEDMVEEEVDETSKVVEEEEVDDISNV